MRRNAESEGLRRGSRALTSSIIANLVLLGAFLTLVSLVGLRPLAEKVGVVEPRRPAYEFYAHERWKGLDGDHRTVLIGDSQIERGPWSELLREPVAARGQGGALTAEVIRWVDTVPASAEHIVIWAGTNDVLQGHTPDQVERDMGALISSLKDQAPHADITILSVPPLDASLAWREANEALAQAAREAHVDFLDLTDALAPAGTRAHDGVHLTADGYEAVGPLVASQTAR